MSYVVRSVIVDKPNPALFIGVAVFVKRSFVVTNEFECPCSGPNATLFVYFGIKLWWKVSIILIIIGLLAKLTHDISSTGECYTTQFDRDFISNNAVGTNKHYYYYVVSLDYDKKEIVIFKDNKINNK